MDDEPLVLYISSDEEPFSSDPKGDDFDWLSEILNEVNGQTATDISDEVLVVGEVKAKHKSTRPAVEDLDDDCVVLDGDPDKPVEVTNAVENGLDDLLIVGERGQIACRDYPHPRHLCAKYPFSSTPHEKYCNLCHCYVCDSVAPCGDWGTGNLAINHCHATDKEECWKLQRRSFRLGKTGVLPKPINTFFPKASAQVTQVSQAQRSNIIRLSSNSIPQHKMPPIVRSCSSANRGSPNITSPPVLTKNCYSANRVAQLRPALTKNRVPQQPLVSQCGVGRRERSPNVGNLGTQALSPRVMFKKVGYVRSSLAANQSTYISSSCLNRHHAPAFSEPVDQTVASIDKNSNTWQNVCPTMDLGANVTQGSLLPNAVNINGSTVSSHPQIYESVLQSNNGQNTYQDQDFSQNFTDTGFPDFNYIYADNTDHSYLQPASENFQLQHAAGNFQHQPTAEGLQLQLPVDNFRCQPAADSFATTPAVDNFTPQLADDNFGSQPTVDNFASQLSSENFQHHSPPSSNEPVAVNDSNSQFPGSNRLGLPEFQFENWDLEDPTILGVSEA